MAEERGLWITNDNGNTYFNLASGGATAINFLQRLRLSGDVKNRYERVTIAGKSAGTEMVMMPVQPYQIQQNGNALYGIAIESFSVSGNVLTINYNSGNNGPGMIGDGYMLVDVYETLPVSAGGYGLYWPGSTAADFAGITNALKAGYCVYRTTVTVSDKWTVPASIPNRNSCSVFGNWSHPTATVAYDANSKQVQVTGGSVSLNIAIFSGGFNLVIPPSGFYIFNNNGVCTYNSNYIPMFLKKTVVLSRNSVDTGITKPLIPLSIPGGEARQGNNGYWDVWDQGVVMSGRTIKTARGKYDSIYYTDGWTILLPNPSIPLPVLDGEQYFN